MPKHTIYRILWIPSAVILVLMTALFSHQTSAMPTVAPMQTYTTDDKSFALRHPGNWKPHPFGANAVLSGVRFTPSDNVKVLVTADLTGSLFADMQKANNDTASALPSFGPEQAAKQKSPLETVHKMQRVEMKGKFEGYKEGKTEQAQIANNEGLVTAFTGKTGGMFSSAKIVGRRATILAGDRRITFVASCLKEMQPELMPVFEEMLESLQIGQGGG
jgi:hypothetical protein